MLVKAPGFIAKQIKDSITCKMTNDQYRIYRSDINSTVRTIRDNGYYNR